MLSWQIGFETGCNTALSLAAILRAALALQFRLGASPIFGPHVLWSINGEQ
jgi:hypothetical protein